MVSHIVLCVTESEEETERSAGGSSDESDEESTGNDGSDETSDERQDDSDETSDERQDESDERQDESDETSDERKDESDEISDERSDKSDESSDERSDKSDESSDERKDESNEASEERSDESSDEKQDDSDEKPDDGSDESGSKERSSRRVIHKLARGQRKGTAYLKDQNLIRVVRQLSQQAQAAFRSVGMDVGDGDEEGAQQYPGMDEEGAQQYPGMDEEGAQQYPGMEPQEGIYPSQEEEDDDGGEEEGPTEWLIEEFGNDTWLEEGPTGLSDEEGEEAHEPYDEPYDGPGGESDDDGNGDEGSTKFEWDEEDVELIANSILLQVPPDVIKNFTAEDFLILTGYAEFNTRTAAYYLSSVNTGVFLELLPDMAWEPGYAPLAAKNMMVEVAISHLGPVSEWTPQNVSRLHYVVCGLSGHHLRDTSAETFREVLVPISHCQQMGHLDVRLGDDVIRAAGAHWGSIGSWSLESLELINPFFRNLHPSQIEHINPAMIMEHLPLFASQELPRYLGRVIIDKLKSSPNWTWSEEQIKSMHLLTQHLTMREFKLIPMEGGVPTDILEEMKEAVHSKRQTKQLVKMMTQSYGDSSSWDAETLRTIGSVAGGLGINEIDHIPDSTLQEAISDIADSGFSPKQQRVIMKKYLRAKARNGSSTLTGDDLWDLGGLVSGISSSDLGHMRPEDMRGAVSVLAEHAKRMKPTQKRQILRTLMNSTEGISEALTDLGDIAQELPLRVLESPQVVGTLFSVADDDSAHVMNAGKVHWTRRQSAKLVKKFMEDVESEDMSESTMRSLGTLATGFQCADIHDFPEDNLMGLIGAMMEQDGWKRKQLRCSADKMRQAFSSEDFVFTMDFEESDLDAITGHVLRHFTLEELSNIPHELCERTIALIGMEEDVIELRREKRQQIVELALDCLGDGAPLTGGTMSLDHLTELGHLRCDLGADVLGSVPMETMSDFVYDFQQCCLDEDQLRVMRERVLEIKGSPSNWTADDLMGIGLLIISFTQEEIELINEAEFSDVVEDVVETMQSVIEKRAQYCEHEMTVADWLAFTDGLTRLAGKLKDSLVAAAQEDEQETRRKKRAAAYSPTCTEIESLGQANVGWTEAELLAMSTETIDSCVYALGVVDGFTTEQSQAIMQRVKAAWGEAADMEAGDVSQLGRIAGQFTVEEIAHLNLSDVDTVWSIAQHDVWTPPQLSAAVDHIRDLSGLTVAEMDSIMLTGLSNFLCGMTPDDLSALSQSAYIEAAASIGQLTTCSVEQWSALKTLAMQEYGSVNAWTVDIYMELGGVVAGFTTAELQTITAEKVVGVAPHALSLIGPADFVSGFNPSVLAAFDSDQIAALTPDQEAAMSRDQHAAMAVAVYGEGEVPSEVMMAIYQTTARPTSPPDDATPGSGSGLVTFSYVVMLYCLALSYSVW